MMRQRPRWPKENIFPYRTMNLAAHRLPHKKAEPNWMICTQCGITTVEHSRSS
jgi:hypothetical protein